MKKIWQFFGTGAVLAIVLAAIKYFFAAVIGSDSQFFIYLEWALIAAASIIAVRSFGIINYMEGAAAALVWLFDSLVFDFLITSQLLGLAMYRDTHQLISYAIMAVAIFSFHRKKHIHVRHELRKKHGAHH